jgi:hypothetical protein
MLNCNSDTRIHTITVDRSDAVLHDLKLMVGSRNSMAVITVVVGGSQMKDLR